MQRRRNSPAQVGDQSQLPARLRGARHARGLSQQEAARVLGVSRPLLIAMEQGTRVVSAVELTSLAGLYGRSVSELMRDTPAFPPLSTQLRATASALDNRADLADLFVETERLGDDYVELARLAGVSLPRRYPTAADTGGLDPMQVAEDLATGERNRLGLGDGPLHCLRELLEDEVGLRLFALPMPTDIAAFYAYAEPLGGCIVVNRDHPQERRRWSLAHEYAHFLTAPYHADVLVLGEQKRVAHQERLADAFAAELLMSRAGLRRRFHELSKERADGVTAADLLQLARIYQVPLPALVARCVALQLVPQRGYGQLSGLGFQSDGTTAWRNDPVGEQVPELLPMRYRYLAVELYLSSAVTEGQLARFLRMDRVAARRTVDGLSESVDVGHAGTAMFRLAEAS